MQTAPLAARVELTPRNRSRHGETPDKNRNRYPWIKRYEEGLTWDLDAAVSRRLLGRPTKLWPRH